MCAVCGVCCVLCVVRVVCVVCVVCGACGVCVCTVDGTLTIERRNNQKEAVQRSSQWKIEVMSTTAPASLGAPAPPAGRTQKACVPVYASVVHVCMRAYACVCVYVYVCVHVRV